MGEPAAVPLALLVTAVVQLALAPAQNLVSRRSEGEADWKALQTTRDPASARGLFREFAATSLGDPSPPTWAYVMLQSHPTLAQRVAMADAWARRRQRVRLTDPVSDFSRTPALDPVGDHPRDRERRRRAGRGRVAHVDDAVRLVEDEVVEQRPVRARAPARGSRPGPGSTSSTSSSGSSFRAAATKSRVERSRAVSAAPARQCRRARRRNPRERSVSRTSRSETSRRR